MSHVKINLLAVLLALCVIGLPSCSDKDVEAQPEGDFVEFTMEMLDDLAGAYPSGDLVLRISPSNGGVQQAVFSLTGDSKKASQLGRFASRPPSEDGTDCDGALSCAKAAAKCLENDKDAL